MAPRIYGKFEQYLRLTGIITDILISNFSLNKIEYWISPSNRDELKKGIVGGLSGVKINLFTSIFFKLTGSLGIMKCSSPEGSTVGKEFIKNFSEPIYERENRIGNIDFHLYIDDDICRKLQGLSVSDIDKNFDVGVYRLLLPLTSNKKILEEAGEAKIQKIYDSLEALFIIRQAILSGEVDKNEAGFVVFLKIKKEDKELYRFRAARKTNSHIGINMYEVNDDFEWPAGTGIGFKKL